MEATDGRDTINDGCEMLEQWILLLCDHISSVMGTVDSQVMWSYFRGLWDVPVPPPFLKLSGVHKHELLSVLGSFFYYEYYPNIQFTIIIAHKIKANPIIAKEYSLAKGFILNTELPHKPMS